jgi:hypothetical protein
MTGSEAVAVRTSELPPTVEKIWCALKASRPAACVSLPQHSNIIFIDPRISPYFTLRRERNRQ